MFDIQLMNKVADADSRNAKVELLRNVSPFTRRMLIAALDPYVTFRVNVDLSQVQQAYQGQSSDNSDELLFGDSDAPTTHMAERPWWRDFAALTERLAVHELTGNAARAAIYQHLVRAPTEDALVWGTRIINKDLRAGVQARTMNAAWPDSVPTFGVMLAFPFKDDHDVSGPAYLEPKIDGVRMLVIDGQTFSRHGGELFGFEAILRDLAKVFVLNEVVIDGELINDKATSFEKISGDVRAKKANKTGMLYCVHDIVSRSQWFSGPTDSLSKRKLTLSFLRAQVEKHRIRSFCVVPFTHIEGWTIAELFEQRDTFIKSGYEGMMWKRASAPYQFKRTHDVLKFKRRETVDMEITGFVEGNGKYVGKLGAFVLRDEAGNETECGAGLTDAQRDEFWQKRKTLLGQFVECEFMTRTNSGKLREPVFKFLRSDK